MSQSYQISVDVSFSIVFNSKIEREVAEDNIHQTSVIVTSLVGTFDSDWN